MLNEPSLLMARSKGPVYCWVNPGSKEGRAEAMYCTMPRCIAPGECGLVMILNNDVLGPCPAGFRARDPWPGGQSTSVLVRARVYGADRGCSIPLPGGHDRQYQPGHHEWALEVASGFCMGAWFQRAAGKRRLS